MIVAQLSDIHANGSERALERLDMVLRWLNNLRPDALIVSGDLAEDEHRSSYRALRERFKDLHCPYFLVPGNVDDHADMRDVFGDRFGWDRDRPLHVRGDIGELTLIGLDVTVPGDHYGDAAPALPWLSDELARDTQPTLIFQHQHPFLCGIDGKDRNMCRNGEGLARLIEDAGEKVVALTCGHVHRPLFTRFAGRHATMAPSVTRANRLKFDGREADNLEPPGLLLHHFVDRRLVSHVVMAG